MDDQDKANLGEIRIRRLKEDINKQSLRPPFAEQLPPEELPIRLTPAESALYEALREYRKKGHANLANSCQFVIFSCSTCFFHLPFTFCNYTKGLLLS